MLAFTDMQDEVTGGARRRLVQLRRESSRRLGVSTRFSFLLHAGVVLLLVPLQEVPRPSSPLELSLVELAPEQLAVFKPLDAGVEGEEAPAETLDLLAAQRDLVEEAQREDDEEEEHLRWVPWVRADGDQPPIPAVEAETIATRDRVVSKETRAAAHVLPRRFSEASPQGGVSAKAHQPRGERQRSEPTSLDLHSATAQTPSVTGQPAKPRAGRVRTTQAAAGSSAGLAAVGAGRVPAARVAHALSPHAMSPHAMSPHAMSPHAMFPLPAGGESWAPMAVRIPSPSSQAEEKSPSKENERVQSLQAAHAETADGRQPRQVSTSSSGAMVAALDDLPREDPTVADSPAHDLVEQARQEDARTPSQPSAMGQDSRAASASSGATLVSPVDRRLSRGERTLLNTRAHPDAEVMQRVDDALRERWDVPVRLRAYGISARTTLEFRVLPNGRIKGLRLAVPSGYGELDRVAVAAVPRRIRGLRGMMPRQGLRIRYFFQVGEATQVEDRR